MCPTASLTMLGKLCRASRVTTKVNVAPVDTLEGRPDSREPALMQTLLTGGDNYEILAAIPLRTGRIFSTAGNRRRHCRH